MTDKQVTIANRLNMFLDKTNASVKNIINGEEYEVRILYQDIKKYIDIIITKCKLWGRIWLWDKRKKLFD